jgi:hypothetical protein
MQNSLTLKQLEHCVNSILERISQLSSQDPSLANSMNAIR